MGITHLIVLCILLGIGWSGVPDMVLNICIPGEPLVVDDRVRRLLQHLVVRAVLFRYLRVRVGAHVSVEVSRGRERVRNRYA